MILDARRTCLAILFLLILACAVNGQAGSSAQAPETKKPATTRDTTRKAADAEAERNLRERAAESLVISLAVDAGSFRDYRLRARTQSRIADLLWKLDPERGRTLFRKAWDAAEIADAEGQAKVQEEIRQQQAKSGSRGYAVSTPPELRREILRLATKRDVALGEEFLAKLKGQKEQDAVTGRNPQSQERDLAAEQRLSLADQLLSAGDTERALQMADPVLRTVSAGTLSFLSSLREKNPTAADERYAAMLTAAANPMSDANTASLLSSYIFTPYLYVTFIGAGGASTSRRNTNTAPPDVSPALRAAYFRSAGEILMRPIPSPGPEHTGVIVSKYYVVKRLMPLFEQFAPPESTAGLRAQLEALSSMITEGQRQSQDETVREGIRPQKPPEDRDQPLLDQVDRARTSTERDQLFFALAMLRAQAGDLKAREYADKIEDSETRHNVRVYIDSLLAMKAVEGKDAERMLELARTGEISHLLRIWTMTRAARFLERPDRERALQVLDDALAEARGMDRSSPDRAYGFLAVANALLAIDRARGWDATIEAVRAANSSEGFTGEDGNISFSVITKTSRSSNQHSVAEFNVDLIFRALAKDDYQRSVELANVFERESPRASAVLAIAETVLTETK